MKLFICALLCVWAPLSLFADAGTFVSSDTFYDSALMPAGPYKGRPLDVTKLRSFVSLSGTAFEQYYGVKPGYQLIGNFYHNGKLHIARVPMNGVQEVSVVFDYFNKSNRTAHVMVLYKLDPTTPLELLAAVPTSAEIAEGSLGDPYWSPVEIYDFLFSVEASSIHGMKYDQIKGMQDNFMATYRLRSLASRIQDTQTIESRGALEKVHLNLSFADRQNSLRQAFDLAEDNKMNTMYHTIYNNCVNNSLSIIQDSFDNPNKFLSFVRSLPLWIKLEIKSRGLLAPNSPYEMIDRQQRIFDDQPLTNVCKDKMATAS